MYGLEDIIRMNKNVKRTDRYELTKKYLDKCDENNRLRVVSKKLLDCCEKWGQGDYSLVMLNCIHEIKKELKELGVIDVESKKR